MRAAQSLPRRIGLVLKFCNRSRRESELRGQDVVMPVLLGYCRFELIVKLSLCIMSLVIEFLAGQWPGLDSSESGRSLFAGGGWAIGLVAVGAVAVLLEVVVSGGACEAAWRVPGPPSKGHSDPFRHASDHDER